MSNKKDARRLRLHKESIRILSAADLSRAGGGILPTDPQWSETLWRETIAGELWTDWTRGTVAGGTRATSIAGPCLD